VAPSAAAFTPCSAGGKKHIDFHLSMPETTSVRQSHDVCDAIERDRVRLMPNASILIHVEPRGGRTS
jgi:divalent metal cation (Fe/Co/Zn/Cd) transporter